ncbi:MAG TPA: hypothetical protein VMV43_02110 [Candidatus Nanopelagicaceae bacterium]|nr:hypothetical protein [Candidatus Nanopelagicaceae bacterium]
MSHKSSITSTACLCLVLLLIFPPYILGSTTLGESTFPVEDESEIIWESVNATESWYMDVEFVRFTASKIYNETYDEKNYLFINYTLEFYHRYTWVPRYTNSFYMAYNKTLNFLNWSAEGFLNGNLFIFPTPINLTLIGEAVKREGFLNYSVIGQKLVLDYYGNNTRIEISINSSGLSTIIEKITNETTIYRWELNEEEIIIKVPFGSNYLMITIASIIPLVVITKKKIAYSRKH